MEEQEFYKVAAEFGTYEKVYDIMEKRNDGYGDWIAADDVIPEIIKLRARIKELEEKARQA